MQMPSLSQFVKLLGQNYQILTIFFGYCVIWFFYQIRVMTMSGSVYIFLLSSYFLCKSASVTPLPVVSTTTKAPDGNRLKLIEAIVAILSIGQPESKIADIRIDVDKKVRESNATDISQVFTKAEYDRFCSFNPGG